MKRSTIKVIKGNVPNEVDVVATEKRPQRSTVTATVKDWIKESRRNKLVYARASRQAVADWTANTDI